MYAAVVQATDQAPAYKLWLERLLWTDFFHGLTLFRVLVIACILLAAWLLSRLAQAMLTRSFQRRKAVDQGAEAVVKRLTHYGIMVAAVFVALDVANVQLTSLFAAGAVFAVVIGFAMQNLSENFVAGVILMIERSITPDDILEVEGRVVRVVKMGIRSTVARTRDEEELIIPNSLLVRSTVKNFTLRDSLYRIRSTVGVSYASDMLKVRQILEAAAASVPWRDGDEEPRILLTDFGSNTVNFEVSVWIEDPWNARTRISDLNEAVWWALKKEGISIAFPQLDLHLDADALEALRNKGRVG